MNTKMPKENKIVPSKVPQNKMRVTLQFALQLLGILLGFISTFNTSSNIWKEHQIVNKTMHEKPQVVPSTPCYKTTYTIMPVSKSSIIAYLFTQQNSLFLSGILAPEWHNFEVIKFTNKDK
jgi:hypothetical protein